MSDRQLDQEEERGRLAGELLAHPLLKEAFDTLRDNYRTAWEASGARDKEGREEVWKLMKTLGAVEGHLRQVMETGKLAQVQKSQHSLFERLKAGLHSATD